MLLAPEPAFYYFYPLLQRFYFYFFFTSKRWPNGLLLFCILIVKLSLLDSLPFPFPPYYTGNIWLLSFTGMYELLPEPTLKIQVRSPD